MSAMLRLEIPVRTPLGEGTTVYVESQGVHMNDMWCVCLDDGRLLHFLSSDLRHVGNGTLGVQAPEAATCETCHDFFARCECPRRELSEPQSVTAAVSQRLAGRRGG